MQNTGEPPLRLNGLFGFFVFLLCFLELAMVSVYNSR